MNSKSFEEKELKILRDSIDYATNIVGKKLTQTEDVKKIIDILESFLRTHKTMCYGGTAVNNILPEQYRFYNRNIEIPDYDFFSPHAIDYAKKLADIYYKAGFTEVEAKAGIHTGTYKVFVNFMPIADITYLENKLFNNIYKKSIKVNAINYCPPNYLRMAMYQELSRPMGDVTRWEKVLKRLILLNKNFPLKGISCNNQDFQRHYEGDLEERNNIYNIARTSFINQGLVFFGGYAASLYGKYMPRIEKKAIDSVPDFDILSEKPQESALILKEQLNYEGYKNVKINKKPAIGEYVDEHYEVVVNKDTIAILYATNSCYSYNNIYLSNQKIKVASIDTMLYFYLIFIYANRPYLDENRLLCMAEYLFKVQLKNRLQQKGLLRRFSVTCYGKQKTLEDIRSEKAEAYREIINKKISKNSVFYNEHFLRYIPSQKKQALEIKSRTLKNKNKKKSKKNLTRSNNKR
tara:strand:+ start:11707 stop:13095 length:1389 start_codon:yes stop_codon:yes gene_type:complete